MIQSSSDNSNVTSSCQRVHAEDLQRGDRIAISCEGVQVPTYAWCNLEPSAFPPERPIEIAFKPHAFRMFKVRSVALPFVLCLAESGEPEVLDVRQVELLRLPAKFVKTCRQARRSARKRQSRRKQKSRKSS